MPPPAARFVDIARAEMGSMVVLPNTQTVTWFAKIGSGLKNGGCLGDDDMRLLCQHVMTWLKTPILLDTLAAKSGSWLPMAKATHKDGKVHMPGKLKGPVEMGD